MKIKNCELECVCGISSNFPKNLLPEYAFAGRSNVGKSSLINALMQRKNLARTSSQPGKTQTVNYYRVNDAFYLVDLPGYGYAKAGTAVSAQWGKMVERYLRSSEQLVNIFLLVDIRHEPTAQDLQMYEWIRAKGYEPLVIATKADKIKRSQLDKQKKMLRQCLKMDAGGILIPFSAESKQGREEIYSLLDETILQDEEK
ncbi:MAG: YihA family ribosome biogenesis GTP-binding protein [Lachnospiraceae bacterium]|nr:YihA family ribosome biogenesis GTP-binding protein [Lachnospiraceae bacterium]